MADRIVVMNRGHIEQVGTPREIYETPATPFAADFVGKINVLPAVAEGGGPVPRRAACRSTSAAPTFPRARATKLYLRPEDIGVHTERHGAGGPQRARRQDHEGRVPRRVLHDRPRASTRPTCRRSRRTCRGRRSTQAASSRAPPSASPWRRPRCACSPDVAMATRRHALRAARRPCRAADHALAGSHRAGPAGRVLRGARAVPARAALHDPREERAGQGRRIRRSPAVPEYMATPRCGSRSGTRCGSRSSSPASRSRSRSPTPTRSRASCMPGEGRCSA